ncbi:TniQ family protein [Paracoccus beibuensis]|uniref:TniQ family protein n=1 Tax=Paracoccus beibuensis TaxID=547602 RepID=UPI00223FA95E|nr:TniQ family protein [Paracoccus beibuensis]
MTLTPFIPINPDETLMSWATRLAAIHVGETLVPFLRDLGLHPDEMLTGSDVAISRLAEVTGANPDDLRRQTIQTQEWRRYDLRGQRFETEFMKGSYVSCCPACLLDDDEAERSVLLRRGRLAWRLRPVRTCPVHRIALLDRPYIDWSDRFHQMGVVFPEAGPSLRALADEQVRRDVSPLQTYVTDRLDGKTGPAWLDGQGIELGARASEMLGVALEFGRKPNLDKMTADDWDRAARIGFEFTSRGEAGIREALGEVQRRAWFDEKIPGQSGPQMIFGRLYQWLSFSKNRKEVGPIREVVREHILETMYVAPGANLMGEEVVASKKHTVGSLAKKSGVHPKTLRNALALAGLIPDNSAKGGEAVFDAKEGERVVHQLGEAVPQKHLPAYMNATRGQVVSLIASGFLKRMMDGGSSARASSAVSKKDVHAFLNSISRDAEVVDVPPAGVWTINKATQKARVTTDEVIKLLQNGSLRNVYRVEGEEGYLSLRVDPEEIKGHFVRDRETVPLGSGAVAKELGTIQSVVNRLAAAGLIASVAPNGRAEALKTVRVLPHSLRQFQETYVFLMQLRRELGVHHRRINTALSRLGVKPVADPAILKVTLFRRADIPLEFYDGRF